MSLSAPSRLRALALPALILGAPAFAGDLDGGAAGLVEQAQTLKSDFCSTAAAFKEFTLIPCTTYGSFDQKDLIHAAKAVFGEASADPDEQCAVALTIFNRARAEGASLKSVVKSPGQFEGYWASDRRECVKLKGAVAAVKTLAAGKQCSFGARRFQYFCSKAGWDRVKKSRKPGSETPEFIGDTAFLIHGPC